MKGFLERIAGLSPQRLALLAAQMNEQLQAREARDRMPIAIVGMGCRFPGGVHSAAGFWQMLRAGTDAISEVPPSRWDIEALYNPDPDAPGKMATRWGGFITGEDLFDPLFFGISPAEAASIDPQQRLLLEVSWEALEDAGIVPASLNGTRTGVFAGICNSDYGYLGMELLGQKAAPNFAAGVAHSVAAGRVAYTLGLQGPALAVDTSCSAGLVSIHLACQSLRSGECDAALAGGVNLILAPEVTMALSQGRMMAPDGRCKAFDDRANGFVRGEGCGMIVLQRLPDALRDGRQVLAVIRGSAINQDGRSSGLIAPNGSAQQAVIRDALRNAGMEPGDIDLIEAHGTGTALGDPIEIGALQAVFSGRDAERRPLYVGSVKSNIGHLESAAGVAGLIKLVLSLRHREIPASLHFETPNNLIDWSAGPVTVANQRTAWPSRGVPRAGGVSSFGISGTNAHVLVEEYPELPRAAVIKAGPRPVRLSARTPRALAEMAARLIDHLVAHPSLTLDDVLFTLNYGRTQFEWQASGLVSSHEDLLRFLDQVRTGELAQRQSRTATRAAAGQETIAERPLGRIVSLPTYPFERERYWLAMPPRRSAATADAIAPVRAIASETIGEPPDRWLYEVQWEPKPLPHGSLADKVWLQTGPAGRVQMPDGSIASNSQFDGVVAGACADSAAAASAAPALSVAQPQTVQPGSDQNPRTVVLDGGDPDLRAALAQELAMRGMHLRTWRDSEDASAQPPATGRAEVYVLIAPAMGLAQSDELAQWALARIQEYLRCRSGRARLWIVTRGAQATAMLAPDGSGVAQSTLWGLGRVLALESPGAYGGLIDLEPACSPADAARCIAAELAHRDGEDQIAWRGGQRLVARLARVESSSAPLGRQAVKFDGDASYLITGGLGGLGLRLAQWMAEQGARHIVLLGRTGLTPDGPDERARQIEALRAQGVQISLIAADIASPEMMTGVFARFGQDLPRLRGIFHAATVVHGAPLAQITASDLLAMLRPKVRGTIVLDALTRNLELDFFVAFSSAAAVLGATNMGHYAAANQFLDSFAHMRRSAGLPMLSVNWGAWDTMRLAADHERAQFTAAGLPPMASEDALNTLAAWLGTTRAQLLIANLDWSVMKPLLEVGRVRPLVARFGQTVATDSPVPARSGGSTADLPALSAQDREAAILAVVSCEAAEILGMRHEDMPRADVELMEMGMDSLMAVDLKNRLQKRFAITLPPNLIFEFATPAAIARALGTMLWAATGQEAAPALWPVRDEIHL